MVGPSVATTHGGGFVWFFRRPGQLVFWSAAAALAWLLIVSGGERLRWLWPFTAAQAVVGAAPCGPVIGQ